ncbi:hypothetical protein DH09_08170 [Bacillaceae bacterium JMAK1]|nr:hypothetical protein DH09_08170 [Bacillaceae bacterium JMAK1]
MLYPTWEVPESVELDMLEDQEDVIIINGSTPLLNTKTLEVQTDNIGRPILVDDLECFAQWIYNIIKTPRGRYIAYSPTYGIQLDDLTDDMDRDVVASEVERRVKELIISDSRAITVRSSSNEIQGDNLFVSFVVDTIYGDLRMNRIRLGGD